MVTTKKMQEPPMEIFNRVAEVPMVELAWEKSLSTYNRVKGSHQYVNWIFSVAENTITSATRRAAPIAQPIARTFQKPIHFVDQSLCLGLEKIQNNVPIIKKHPEQILENAYMLALTSVQPAVSRISYVNELIRSQANSIKDVSWNKINQVLGTYYGTAAVNGVDSAAGVVDKLLDRYFPPVKEENLIHPCSAEEDKLLHTLQTVGRLSNKAAQRVYFHVFRQLRTLQKSHLRNYIDSVVEFLHLTRYVQTIPNHQIEVTANHENKINHENHINYETSEEEKKTN